jgi:hypothetical protein
VPQRAPGQFRKLDAVAVLTGPLLPAPLASRSRLWTPTSGGWVGGGDVACDGLGSGAGVALEGPDGGVAGPGEQHRGAGAANSRDPSAASRLESVPGRWPEIYLPYQELAQVRAI